LLPNKCMNGHLFNLLMLLALLTTTIEPALANPETNPTNTPPPASTNESGLPTLSSTSNLNQQAGFIQNYGSWNGSPNCPGTCVFATLRAVPNGNSNNIEASVSFVWQLHSLEYAQAQANRAKTDAEREQLTAQTDLVLTEKLSEAIEKNQPERVNAIAMILAKRLGYPNHHQYLTDIFNTKHIRRVTTQIYIPSDF
jgi:hypothetical protein